MNRKMLYGAGCLGAVLFKILGTVLLRVNPHIVNVTITAGFLVVGMILFALGIFERKKAMAKTTK